MAFRFNSNLFSQASRSLAAGLSIIGLMLVGFGVLIIALPELFAFLAAMVFFIAGITAVSAAVKMFISINRMFKSQGDDNSDEPYRVNVRVRRQDDDVEF